MRASADPTGNLVVTSSESWLLVLAIVLCAGAGAVWLGDRTVGFTLAWSIALLGGAVLCVAGWERSRFVFDRTAGELVWRRWTPFRSAGGRVSFGEITSLSLQQDFGTHGQRSDARRLVIHTASGIVPVTTAFEAGRARYERVAQRIIATLRDANPRAPAVPLVE